VTTRPLPSDTPTLPNPATARPRSDAVPAELADRLAWFVRIRWGAVAGLLASSLVGPALGLTWMWPGLFILGLGVAVYNVVCWWCLGARRHGTVWISLRVSAMAQIALDLAALLVAVHYTGGLASPLLVFFGFHMAIGTILVATDTMYFVAGLTSLGALGLYILESSGVLGQHSLSSAFVTPEIASVLGLLSLVGYLFGIVYLTGSVTDRLKRRNLELRETTDALEQRTADLQRLLDELEELERRKSYYMRISAHQLRSPLATVRTALDVMNANFIDLASPRGRRLLHGVTERVNGLLQTVNDLLDLAKVREGRARAPWAPRVILNQLLADLFDALSPYAEERNVRLTPVIDGVVILDWGVPPDLVYAFENLMQNAIKYSLAGGEVTVRLSAMGDHAVLSVEDQGIGVPADFREQLFLEFVRAPNARQHAPEGTGLGLALVREVAVAHGGTVALDETDGPGTTFRLELPLHRVPPDWPGPLHGGYRAGYAGDTEGLSSEKID
jgi:signal transduction histidine kinase